MFDISQLNQGSFRGVEFYTKKTDNSSGHRLTNHKFINGGTQTEDNGLSEDVYNIEAYVVGENYLTDKANLKKALDVIGTGTLIDRFYGELQVKVDSYSITDDKTEYGIARFNIKFVKDENKPITEKQSLVVQDLTQDTKANFIENFDNKLGNEALKEVTQGIQTFLNNTSNSISFIDNSLSEIKKVKNAINTASISASDNILSSDTLFLDIVNVSSSFDDLFESGIFTKDNQIQFQNSLLENLKNTDVPSDGIVSQSISNSIFTYSTAITTLLNQKSIQNLENIDFVTGDEFGSVKNSSLEIYEILEQKNSELANNSSNITQTQNTLNYLDNLKAQRSQYISFYTQKYSGLQNLEDDNIVTTTDLYSYAINKYKDINRIDEVMNNNNIVDPIFVSKNIKVLEK